MGTSRGAGERRAARRIGAGWNISISGSARTGDTTGVSAEATGNEKRPREQTNQGSWADWATVRGNDLGVVTSGMHQSRGVFFRGANRQLELAGSGWLVVVLYRGVKRPGFRGYSLWYHSRINGEFSRSVAGCHQWWS
jgi:hypothetical protein